MPTLGMGELLVILVIVLLIFGASRLPQIGEGIGKAVRNLKRGLSTDDDIDVTPSERRVEKESSARSVKEAEVSEAEVVDKH
ncbi:MAG: twin-arginine translocase TatA/TatE family subunit [Myxococcales bacterium]|nr:twin-arginine translocase TatA/TatE family subunit [Myxococcales bacterium]